MDQLHKQFVLIMHFADRVCSCCSSQCTYSNGKALNLQRSARSAEFNEHTVQDVAYLLACSCSWDVPAGWESEEGGWDCQINAIRSLPWRSVLLHWLHMLCGLHSSDPRSPILASLDTRLGMRNDVTRMMSKVRVYWLSYEAVTYQSCTHNLCCLWGAIW